MFKNALKHFKNKSLFWIFVGFYLLFTLFTFRDYGITEDEYGVYVIGAYHLKHYYHHTTLTEYNLFTDEMGRENFIYAAFLHVLSLLIAEKLHFFNMLFALFAYWASYRVLLSAYQKPWWALCGPFILFLTFRFSGDVPTNPKDVPFAVLYLLTLAWIYLIRQKTSDRIWESIVLGSLIGWTASCRAIGLTLFFILFFYRFYENLIEAKDRNQKPIWLVWLSREWKGFLAVFFISQFWLMAFWPYLGSNYFGNLPNLFLLAKSYPWTGPILFMGQKISTLDEPRYYLPLWILISIPLFIVIFSLASIVLFKSKTHTKEGRLYALMGFAFGLNMLMYLIFKPVIYNALRHFLFLVPILCVIGTMGLIEFFTGKFGPVFKKTMAFLVALNVLLVLVELFRLYPYQYAYFNEIVGNFKGATGRFEQDYWSLNKREAILWIRYHEATDPNKIYRIKILDTPWQSTYYFAPNMQGDVNISNPDYELSKDLPSNLDDTKPLRKLVHVVEREGVPLVYILKDEH